MMKVAKLLIIFFSFTFLPQAISFEQEHLRTISSIEVIVGSGRRPPFLSEAGVTGAGPEILQVLNTIQHQFNFVLKNIPTKRRQQAIDEGWIDVMMWDNPVWGWQNHSIETSAVLLDSKDIFIARNQGNSQTIFDNLSIHKLALVYGYHYKFAEFKTDANELSERFNVTFVRTEEAAIKMLLAGRVDITVISETSLNWFLLRFPSYREKVYISKRVDTHYQRYFLVPPSAPIHVEELNQLLALADYQGLLLPIYKRYGLLKPKFK
jgi:ABC-type amino acid transport substrate-binding protein